MENLFSKKIFIGSDHAGFSLKKFLKSHLASVEWVDVGTDSEGSVDYPDYAHTLAKSVCENPDSMGLLICGSGQGMSMTANKYANIRAALCWNEESAKLSREHNNANVLCLSSRLVEQDQNLSIFEIFFTTAFLGERHLPRTKKIPIRKENK